MSRLIDLTGQRFGALTVLGRAKCEEGHGAWLCRCDCGNEKVVRTYDLRHGRVKSCGCMRYTGRKRTELTGQRFGRLTALYPTERRDQKGSIYWRCRCDCGRETEVTENGLVHGNNKSCGCLKEEIQKQISSQLHMVDGTCVEMLEKRKYRSDNTSGFRGVYHTKNGNYRVSIGFKGKRYSVGTFKDYEEAVKARVDAEELIHEGFVKAYRKWQEKAEDPDWAQENPFVYEVEKVNGTFTVVTV